MSLKTRLARMFVGSLSQDDLLRIAGDLLDERLSGMSGEEQAAFLQQFVEENLEWTLADLDRAQRAQLMNRLLPLVARHFPLEEVDILEAFASFEGPESPGWETA
jgi:hypothetical protein